MMKGTGSTHRGWAGAGPAGQAVRVLSAGLLLAWGVSLAFSGLGLQHSLAAAWFNAYWPAPFLIYGLSGLFWPRAVGLGFGLSALVVVGSLLLLLERVPVPGLHLTSLVGAAVVIVLALLVMSRKGRWRW